jgi:cell wall-associated NlpC family hydrolase
MLLLAFFPPAASAAVRTTYTQRYRAGTIAASKVGAPYKWGAAGPSSFDCSGLVVYSYKRAGHALGVRTTSQIWNIGRRIKRPYLKRGDIVYVYSRSHVGVYLGRGRFVHAPAPGRKVSIAALPRTGSGGFIAGVRP